MSNLLKADFFFGLVLGWVDDKPELVVVIESPTSEENMKKMFAEMDGELRKHPEVGEYNQKI